METTCADHDSVLSVVPIAEPVRLAMTDKTPEESLQTVIGIPGERADSWLFRS